MSQDEKHIKWLYNQLPSLTTKGVISSETATRLKDHFGSINEKSTTSIALIITGVLGAVLVGAGIILIFGVNWEQFSTLQRTVLSILPLIFAQLLYGFTFFKRPKLVPWIESTSIFLMLMLASSLALISQTYHIEGETSDFLLTWLLLSIPLMYLMNSSACAILFMTLSTWWLSFTFSFSSHSPTFWYWLFLIAVLPHLFLNIYGKKIETRQLLLSWIFIISFTLAMCIIYSRKSWEIGTIAVGFITPVVYLAGKYVFAAGKTIWHRPFQTVALGVMILVCLIFSYSAEYRTSNLTTILDRIQEEGFSGDLKSVFVLISLVAFIVLAYLRINKKLQTNPFVLCFPLLTALVVIESDTITVVFSNLFLLSFAIYYIYNGITYQKLSLINTGMIIISALIVLRFVDSSISFMVKGIVFLIIGLCFLFANFYLSKKYRLNE